MRCAVVLSTRHTAFWIFLSLDQDRHPLTSPNTPLRHGNPMCGPPASTHNTQTHHPFDLTTPKAFPTGLGGCLTIAHCSSTVLFLFAAYTSFFLFSSFLQRSLARSLVCLLACLSACLLACLALDTTLLVFFSVQRTFESVFVFFLSGLYSVLRNER
jgi:hypothetical protein